jgi:hypothetical protein
MCACDKALLPKEPKEKGRLPGGIDDNDDD